MPPLTLWFSPTDATHCKSNRRSICCKQTTFLRFTTVISLFSNTFFFDLSSKHLKTWWRKMAKSSKTLETIPTSHTWTSSIAGGHVEWAAAAGVVAIGRHHLLSRAKLKTKQWKEVGLPGERKLVNKTWLTRVCKGIWSKVNGVYTAACNFTLKLKSPPTWLQNISRFSQQARRWTLLQLQICTLW